MIDPNSIMIQFIYNIFVSECLHKKNDLAEIYLKIQ